tara:strand:- start:67 stop:486 length:420 start_codon:yes stop_codon:yes gene_type:complete
MSDSCLFCDIAKGAIPASVVYEDDIIMGFLDINPLSVGHTLIITKDHYESLLDIPSNFGSKLFSVAQKVSRAQKEVLGVQGVNWLQNNGAAAGQEVFHFHIHLIPRIIDDGIGLIHKSSQTIKPDSFDQIAKRISRSLA